MSDVILIILKIKWNIDSETQICKKYISPLGDIQKDPLLGVWKKIETQIVSDVTFIILNKNKNEI